MGDPANPNSRAEALYQALRDAIASGELPRGAACRRNERWRRNSSWLVNRCAKPSPGWRGPVWCWGGRVGCVECAICWNPICSCPWREWVTTEACNCR